MERTSVLPKAGDGVEQPCEGPGGGGASVPKEAARLREENSSENRNRITLQGHFQPTILDVKIHRIQDSKVVSVNVCN